ncbi:DUF4254 domain-containing protein [Nocardia sp. CA-119907]|uniref:DUF4254 domain-containing protein n=1 Tax=Nocardia sp. CA-119907 TaxID=3239973 RepID=UPI003D9527AB
MTTPADAQSIPSKDLLLTAIRGWGHNSHPLLDAAQELVQLHQQSAICSASQFDTLMARRIQLVHCIDTCVRTATPSPLPAARIHTERLGSVVDRIAQLSAHLAVATVLPVFERIWIQLDDLADGYQHLIDDLQAGIRRGPRSGEPG